MARPSTPVLRRSVAVAALVLSAAVVTGPALSPVGASGAARRTTSTTAPDGSTITTSATSTTTSTSSTTTSVPTSTPPPAEAPPGTAACSPNWYRGSLMGETTESGSRPGGVEEAKVPASDLGATVAVESVLVRDGGEGGFSTFEERITLTIDGQVHRLTTAPHPAYGHYPSRTPSGFDVPGGTLAVSRVDGGTWVEFSQATSGAYGSFGWKLGSCETISDPEVGVAPRGEARPGRAGYTG